MATVDRLAALSLSCPSAVRGVAVAREGEGARAREERRTASHRLGLSGLGEGCQWWTGTAWLLVERRSREMLGFGARATFVSSTFFVCLFCDYFLILHELSSVTLR